MAFLIDAVTMERRLLPLYCPADVVEEIEHDSHVQALRRDRLSSWRTQNHSKAVAVSSGVKRSRAGQQGKGKLKQLVRFAEH